jgi:hypothetical protein
MDVKTTFLNVDIKEDTKVSWNNLKASSNLDLNTSL